MAEQSDVDLLTDDERRQFSEETQTHIVALRAEGRRQQAKLRAQWEASVAAEDRRANNLYFLSLLGSALFAAILARLFNVPADSRLVWVALLVTVPFGSGWLFLWLTGSLRPSWRRQMEFRLQRLERITNALWLVDVEEDGEPVACEHLIETIGLGERTPAATGP